MSARETPRNLHIEKHKEEINMKKKFLETIIRFMDAYMSRFAPALA